MRADPVMIPHGKVFRCSESFSHSSEYEAFFFFALLFVLQHTRFNSLANYGALQESNATLEWKITCISAALHEFSGAAPGLRNCGLAKPI